MSNTLKRILQVISGLLVLLVIVFLLGPKPPEPSFKIGEGKKTWRKVLSSIPDTPAQISQFIKKEEKKLPVREGNGSRLIWGYKTKKRLCPKG